MAETPTSMLIETIICNQEVSSTILATMRNNIIIIIQNMIDVAQEIWALNILGRRKYQCREAFQCCYGHY